VGRRGYTIITSGTEPHRCRPTAIDTDLESLHVGAIIRCCCGQYHKLTVKNWFFDKWAKITEDEVQWAATPAS
jgi:hypothetical protein